jgi:hypothetical protein
MKNPLESLAYALEKYPERVEVAPVEELMLESARQNAKRPAYVKLAMPDEAVKSLRGSADKRSDLLLLVQIPKEVLERSESRIILPGEVG